MLARPGEIASTSSPTILFWVLSTGRGLTHGRVPTTDPHTPEICQGSGEARLPRRIRHNADMNSAEQTVERIARLAIGQALTVAAAESLTSGLIASRLGAGPDASKWFRGSVVAYQEPVKFEVLGVRRGPVVTRECAEAMARGVGRLMGADVAVAATGVGGPEPSEGKPAGTVYVAVTVRDSTTVHELALGGDPEQILEATADHTLELLATTLTSIHDSDRDGATRI